MIEIQQSNFLRLPVVIHPKIQQQIGRDFQKSAHFMVSKKLSLSQVTVRHGDPSDLSVYERTHLALHHPTTKANNRGSEGANSWAALTVKAKDGNLVPLLLFHHQTPFSCPISLSKSEQVSTASSSTQSQEPLFSRSSTSSFSPHLYKVFFCLSLS